MSLLTIRRVEVTSAAALLDRAPASRSEKVGNNWCDEVGRVDEAGLKPVETKLPLKVPTGALAPRTAPTEAAESSGCLEAGRVAEAS